MSDFAYHRRSDKLKDERFRKMPLFILGINHNTAPVHIRETVVFESENHVPALQALTGLPGVNEAMVLSTCNRTEIIGAGDLDALAQVRDWLVQQLALKDDARNLLFDLSDLDVSRHLCRVAAGLDSAILGEPQIAGQLKDAFREAQSHGAAGPLLDRLCRHAFSTAKLIRTETAIGESPVSVAYAAVSLASKLLDRFERQTALLVGAGETIQLVARHLVRARVGRIYIANRTLSRAEEVAAEFGGLGLPLDAIDTVLPEADIIVASTGSPDPVIRAEQMSAAARKRRRRQPVFVADIAVPRDVEPEVGRLGDVYLYTVDDLQGVITESLASRQQAAVDAEALITQAVERFDSAGRGVQAAPLIRSVRAIAEIERDQLLAEAHRRLKNRSPEEVLDFLANTLTNKLLHKPSDAIRKAAERDDQDLLNAAARLYSVDDQE